MMFVSYLIFDERARERRKRKVFFNCRNISMETSWSCYINRLSLSLSVAAGVGLYVKCECRQNETEKPFLSYDIYSLWWCEFERFRNAVWLSWLLEIGSIQIQISTFSAQNVPMRISDVCALYSSTFYFCESRSLICMPNQFNRLDYNNICIHCV